MFYSYPCEVRVGDYIVMKDDKKLKVTEVDWKYIHTKGGRCFSFRHPDIKGVFVEEAAPEENVQEEPQEEEQKNASNKKTKKVVEEKKEEE